MKDDAYDIDLGTSELLRALTAAGSDRELQGEDAAVAAFRAAVSGRGPRRHGRLRLASGLGATLAASGLLLSATAVTAAAYTSTLPHAAQRTAHHLFHRLGVPGPPEPVTRGSAASSHPTGDPDDRSRASDHRVPRLPAARLELRVDAATAVVGQTVHASVRGSLHSGVLVLLEARHPGELSWTVAGRQAARAGREVVLSTGPLAATVELRAVVEHTGTVSAVVRVHVRPRLSFDADPSRHALRVLTDAGERGRAVVLQELVGGSWEEVQQTAVDAHGAATFRLPPLDGHELFRVVLPRSSRLEAGVSPTLRVEAR